MRAQYQVLVLPYRIKEDIEYLVLKRSDLDVWQGIAGGGEDEDSSTLHAAKRELREELGACSHNFIVLDSRASIPVHFFKNDRVLWGDDVYVIPEYSFGVDIASSELILSHEHKAYKWCSYKEAYDLLEWDSNRVALWELNERLIRHL